MTDIEPHTEKKIQLTYPLLKKKKKKKKSRPTYPLLKHLSRQLQTNNFLRPASCLLVFQSDHQTLVSVFTNVLIKVDLST